MNYIALSFSLKVTKISAHEDRALHLYDIAMADVTLGLIYTYLIFVIFFTRAHFESYKFDTRKVRKFTT